MYIPLIFAPYYSANLGGKLIHNLGGQILYHRGGRQRITLVVDRMGPAQI